MPSSPRGNERVSCELVGIPLGLRGATVGVGGIEVVAPLDVQDVSSLVEEAEPELAVGLEPDESAVRTESTYNATEMCALDLGGQDKRHSDG
jgi:hypothetical protein